MGMAKIGIKFWCILGATFLGTTFFGVFYY